MHTKLLIVWMGILACPNAVAQIWGCTDPLANNYNATATHNNGTCTYNATSLSASQSSSISSTLDETSGLVWWNEKLWTHNDNTDLHLYGLDTVGNINTTYTLANTANYDWEEIAQDADYLYVGDIGNNGNGNRTDLHILRIAKNSLSLPIQDIDTIYFSYADQSDFSPAGANNTNYDCEAFIVTADSLYLFTKQWVSNGTAVYALPKTVGTHVAQLRQTHNVQGLVTGATYLPTQRVVVLLGYSPILQPFCYLLYDFNGTNFFSGNRRKVSLNLPFHQTEGIATINGLTYYVTNEYFSTFVTTPQKLHRFDLSGLLGNYIQSVCQPTITGVAEVCADNIYTYNTDIVSNAIYTWTISGNGTIISGQGTSTLQVQWHSGTVGTVSVLRQIP